MDSESYITLKIKPHTAKEFRRFSKDLRKKHSETLQLMLDFFSTNGLSPLEQLGPNFTTLEKRIMMRINAVVAIIRNIEKTQTRPVLTMMQLLFQEIPAKNQVLVEKKGKSESLDNKQRTELQKKYQVLQNKIYQSKTMMTTILRKVVISRSSFGKVQLRLMMSQAEFEELKQKIENL